MIAMVVTREHPLLALITHTQRGRQLLAETRALRQHEGVDTLLADSADILTDRICALHALYGVLRAGRTANITRNDLFAVAAIFIMILEERVTGSEYVDVLDALRFLSDLWLSIPAAADSRPDYVLSTLLTAFAVSIALRDEIGGRPLFGAVNYPTAEETPLFASLRRCRSLREVLAITRASDRA